MSTWTHELRFFFIFVKRINLRDLKSSKSFVVNNISFEKITCFFIVHRYLPFNVKITRQTHVRIANTSQDRPSSASLINYQVGMYAQVPGIPRSVVPRIVGQEPPRRVWSISHNSQQYVVTIKGVDNFGHSWRYATLC